MINGPLQLSHKYEFDILRENFRHILESYWPVSLARWDAGTISEQLRRLRASTAELTAELTNPGTLYA